MNHPDVEIRPPQNRTMTIAPVLPQRKQPLQFGMGGLFVFVSLGGPILAALLLVSREFYFLVFTLIGIVWTFVMASLAVSYLRPAWTVWILVASLALLLICYAAVFWNRLGLPPVVLTTLVISAWVQALAATFGFLISFSRYQS